MKRILGFVVLAAATALTACQPDNKPAVSLEQAKHARLLLLGDDRTHFDVEVLTVADLEALGVVDKARDDLVVKIGRDDPA